MGERTTGVQREARKRYLTGFSSVLPSAIPGTY